MAGSGSISRRYARALIAIGRDHDRVDRLGADLDAIARVLDLDEGRLGAALANPALTPSERRAVVEEVLGRLDLDRYTANFLRLLVDKNRLGEFAHIRRDYHEMADELAGRVRATVTTARSLDAASAQRVREALAAVTHGELLIDFKVDPGLIGGLVAQIGDKVYDASVRTRLEDLRAELLNGAVPLAEA